MNVKSNILIGFIFLALLSCKSRKEAANKALVQKESVQLQFDGWFHEANSEKLIGHDEKAITLFNKCLGLKPNSAACYYGLSEIYAKNKDAQKAIEYAQKSYALNKTNKWYVVHLADLFYETGNYHQSAEFYGKLINDFEEKNINYKFKYAESLIYSNQTLQAIEQLDLIELEVGKTPELSLTKHDLYNSIGKSKEAQNEIDQLLLEYPNNEEVRETILNYYLQTNQVEKAQIVAKDLLSINENNGQALLGLADVEIRQDHIDKAFDYLERGFAQKDVESSRKLSLLNGLTSYSFDGLNPNAKKINQRLLPLFELLEEEESNNAEFLGLYGKYLEINNQEETARELFLKSINIDPSNYNKWDALLNLDYQLEWFDSLYFDGLKSIDYFPAQPMMYLLTGIGAYETQRFEEAEEYLVLGKDLVVQDAELLSEFQYHLGKNAWKQNNKASGKTYFDKALKTYPANYKIYNGYALLLLEDGKLELAENEIIKALSQEFNNPFFVDTYGLILIAQKKYKEAVDQYDKIFSSQITDYKIIEHYGDALFLNGNQEKAVEMWEKSKSLGNASVVLTKKINEKNFYAN